MAKKVELVVEHSLEIDEALTRMKALTDYYQNKYGAKVAWDRAQGSLKVRQLMVEFQCDFTVDGQKVRLEGTDPGFILRKRAYEYLEAKLRRYLDPNNPAESLPRR